MGKSSYKKKSRGRPAGDAIKPADPRPLEAQLPAETQVQLQAEEQRAPAPRRKPMHPVLKALSALASLKLTVVLLALSVVLVFCGTLAQIDQGIWSVVNTYFRSAYVFIPFAIFFPRTLAPDVVMFLTGLHVPLTFPFPGGWAIGTALLVNLLSAHAVRFKLSWKRSGILVLHAGLIVLMLSEFITGMWAVEGNMAIETGGSANYVSQTDKMELAVVTPVSEKKDEEVVVPARFLSRSGLIHDDKLPFDVQVDRYMVNSSDPQAPRPGQTNPATEGFGRKGIAVEQKEGVGVDPDQKVDTPSAYVTLKRKGTDESLGTYLVYALWAPQRVETDGKPVEVDGKQYEIALRPKREYTKYTIRLKEFHHDVYPGTQVPKNFSSKIQLVDEEHNENREVLIKMNDPLRYRGETFYQSGTLAGDSGTVLQVVRNPGWVLPYVACIMVGAGMVIHFGMGLITFLQKRAMA